MFVIICHFHKNTNEDKKSVYSNSIAHRKFSGFSIYSLYPVILTLN